jgi:hypothetical protein
MIMSAVGVPPSLGSKPVSIKVSMKKTEDQGELADALRALYRKGEFCDINLACGEQIFPCHKAVLAGRSPVFKEGLERCPAPAAAGGRQEVRLVEVSNPEAVRFMLDFLYDMDQTVWKDYNPATQEINKDVLRLAQRFELPGLTGRAMNWLAKDVTTGNVVERLAICSEFGLDVLRGKLIEQLTLNRAALQEVAHSPQIMKYPELMQALLQQTAAFSKRDAEDGPAAKRQKTSPPKKGGK